MDKYIYDGPVMFFGRFTGNWKGETMASSEAEARKNLTYQCKKRLKLGAGASGIGLPGEITKTS
jgi:hypothetical protein